MSVVRKNPDIDEMFRVKRRKTTEEKSPGEISLLVEKAMATLELAAEDDADLNRQEKPAIRKIQTLPLLTDLLSKKKLQEEVLDHGVLSLLKKWLEPLPDGSLPNPVVRASILNILTDLPIDLCQDDRREQLARSGLGRVIMFLSKSDEETTPNKKLAKGLIEKWSRAIYKLSTNFSHLREIEEKKIINVPRRPRPGPGPGPASAAIAKQAPTTMESKLKEADMDLTTSVSNKLAKQATRHQRASIPEATPAAYWVRPQSTYNADVAMINAKQFGRPLGERRERIVKKLKTLKAANRKHPLQVALPMY